MSLFFTANDTASNVLDLSADERILSVRVQAWAGQAGEPAFFCIGNEGTEDRSLTLYVSTPDIQLSTDGRWWHPAIDYAVQAGKIGNAVFVRAIADLDAIEADRFGYVHADDSKLSVYYFLAESNEGDTSKSQAQRFSGENTREIADFFTNDGEAVRIIEYEPQTKPTEPITNPTTLLELNSRTVREWCNPANRAVGFRAYQHWTRAFIGDKDEMTNAMYSLSDLVFTFSDTNAILLPADFAGFSPTWRKTLVPFGIEDVGRSKYQGTVWTVWRDNNEYALRNIRRGGFFKGQVLFWYADLTRVHYPGGSNEDGFLPWNELLDVNWKPIDYVRSWSQTHVDLEYVYFDGYC